MKTVNIRQLKTNPSTALAAARDDDTVVVMNRDHPQALLVDLEQLGVPGSCCGACGAGGGLVS
jgi:antitoxin (DNA-binding transcriptional repressor) of toxin-antitoxin stability system